MEPAANDECVFAMFFSSVYPHDAAKVIGDKTDFHFAAAPRLDPKTYKVTGGSMNSGVVLRLSRGSDR